MIKLLQVELKKIFKRKSIYILWGLMLLFCFLNNILYFTDYDEDGNYKYFEKEDLTLERDRLNKELSDYDVDKLSDITIYVTIKTKIDIIDIKKKFEYGSWQYKKINDYLYDILYQINYYEVLKFDVDKLNYYYEQYEFILNKFNNDDYEYFLNLEIQNNSDRLVYVEELYDSETDEQSKLEIEKQIEDIKFNLKILNYRLEYNIKEDDSYLNIALESYCESYRVVSSYNEIGILTHEDKLNYQNALAKLEESQYIILNKQNINKQNNLNYQLRTILEDYEIFIVLLLLIVCGVIICDEFKDGTIKLLLIKPYSRCKILLSKYFACVIVVVVTLLFLIGVQMIIGGILFGFDSLEIPVVVYDFNKAKLLKYHVFDYMLIRIVFKIPFLMILITMCILLGVLTNSLVISITMPLFLYMFSPTMSYLAVQYKLEFMKYLVNINWNLVDYLFGRCSEVVFINYKFSIILLLIYFVILVILTFVIFRKKNIKNI